MLQGRRIMPKCNPAALEHHPLSYHLEHPKGKMITWGETIGVLYWPDIMMTASYLYTAACLLDHSIPYICQKGFIKKEKMREWSACRLNNKISKKLGKKEEETGRKANFLSAKYLRLYFYKTKSGDIFRWCTPSLAHGDGDLSISQSIIGFL